MTEHHSNHLFQVDSATCGIDALVRRRISGEQLWEVLRDLLSGRVMFSRDVFDDGKYPVKLSNRELEVLRLWADDRSDREIADNLTLSLNTVRTHARNILSKLHVSKRQDAIQRIRRLGMI